MILATENQIHEGILQLARYTLRGWFVCHIPNGGNRNAQTGALMKRLGTMPGMPDLLCISPRGVAHFLEIKKPGGRLSRVQRSCIATLRESRCPVAVASSPDEAQQVFADWKQSNHSIADRSIADA